MNLNKFSVRVKENKFFEKKNFYKNLIQKKLSKEKICILKCFFKKKEINNLIKWVINFRKKGLKGNFKYNNKTKNHYKIVDKNISSERPTKFVLHQFFLWNKEENQKHQSLFEKYVRMRNIINNEEEYECIKFMKKYVSWISMLQYRKGGDFLSPHTDNLNLQVILSMSKLGKDFKKGGQYLIHDKYKHIYVEKYLDIGDVVIFPSKLTHGVYPIDPETKNKNGGRWILFSPFHKKVLLKNR